MKINPLTSTDFYKSDHIRQYPANTSLIYSNFTCRSDKHALKSSYYDNKTVFFGLQYYIKYFLIETWNEEFFNKDKSSVVAKYKRRLDTSLGKDSVCVKHIEALHDLGYLPVEIKALPENSLVPIKVPALTIQNTLPEFFWLTNYLETSLSASLWKPITNATTARQYRLILEDFANQTCDNNLHVDYQAHDFSARGMSCIQDIAISGAAHLQFFKGTDSIPAIDLLEDYYGKDAEKEVIGCSVYATEHSVMCAGTKEKEFETFKRLITETYPTGIVSIVSDTWDLWNVLTNYIPKLKNEIEARDGKVVIRPDSGDPETIICGNYIPEFKNVKEAQYRLSSDMYDEATKDCEGMHNLGAESYSRLFKIKNEYYKIVEDFEYNRHDKTYYYIDNCRSEEKRIKITKFNPSNEDLGALNILYNTFGGSINDKGYKVLDPKIGLIYGDSITLERAESILKRMESMGFASSNIVFGIGAFTYQYVTRDTYGCATKATYAITDNESLDLFKDPITDDGVKKSAKGLLKVINNNKGDYELIDEQKSHEGGELKTVFKNGLPYINNN